VRLGLKLTCSKNNKKFKKKNRHAHLKSIITAKQNVLLPTGAGKSCHLPKWFVKSPKWKRLQAFFRLLSPHYGKC
jgi:hypothetical protein